MASLVWGCCRLIGAMPHWLRYYVLQDTIYFIVYKCLRYRVGVVTARPPCRTTIAAAACG